MTALLLQAYLPIWAWEKLWFGQQINKREELRTPVCKHWLLTAFFLPRPLWPKVWVNSRETKARRAGSGEIAGHLLGCQSAWRGAASVPEAPGPPAASEGLTHSQNHFPALATSQPAWESWEHSAQARASWPPSLQTGRDTGDVVVTSFPWVWAAGSVTSHPKALVILAPFQSPMVAETWKQRADESWDSQAPLYFDDYLFPVSPSLASPFRKRLKNVVSHFFSNPRTSSTMCTCQCFVVNRNSWFHLICPGNPPVSHTVHRSLELHKPMHWSRCHSLKINL